MDIIDPRSVGSAPWPCCRGRLPLPCSTVSYSTSARAIAYAWRGSPVSPKTYLFVRRQAIDDSQLRRGTFNAKTMPAPHGERMSNRQENVLSVNSSYRMIDKIALKILPAWHVQVSSYSSLGIFPFTAFRYSPAHADKGSAVALCRNPSRHRSSTPSPNQSITTFSQFS